MAEADQEPIKQLVKDSIKDIPELVKQVVSMLAVGGKPTDTGQEESLTGTTSTKKEGE